VDPATGVAARFGEAHVDETRRTVVLGDAASRLVDRPPTVTVAAPGCASSSGGGTLCRARRPPEQSGQSPRQGRDLTLPQLPNASLCRSHRRPKLGAVYRAITSLIISAYPRRAAPPESLAPAGPLAVRGLVPIARPTPPGRLRRPRIWAARIAAVCGHCRDPTPRDRHARGASSQSRGSPFEAPRRPLMRPESRHARSPADLCVRATARRQPPPEMPAQGIGR